MSYAALLLASTLLAAQPASPVEIHIFNQAGKGDKPIPRAHVTIISVAEQGRGCEQIEQGYADQNGKYVCKRLPGKWAEVTILVVVPEELAKNPNAESHDRRVEDHIVIKMLLEKVAGISPDVDILYQRVWVFDQFLDGYVPRIVQLRKVQRTVFRPVYETAERTVSVFDPRLGCERTIVVPYTVCRQVASTVEAWERVLVPMHSEDQCGACIPLW